MTPIMLMNQLEAYLRELTKDMRFGSERLPLNFYQVDLPALAIPEYEDHVTDIEPMNMTIPDKRDERWPFILIMCNGPVEDNEDGYRVLEIDIAFGCEERGRDGYMDVMHLMEHVRTSFLRETYEGWNAQLVRPLTLGLAEDPTDPYWLGYMSTTWEMPSIEQEVWKFDY